MATQPTKVDLSGDLDPNTTSEKMSFLQSENETSNSGGGLGAWIPNLIPAKTATATEWISTRRKGLRPWREFVKTDKFKLPSSPVVAGRRIITNVEQFQSNYFCVFIILVVYCILTSPMLLVALAVLFGASYYIRSRSADRPLKIGSIELSPAYQYAAVALLSFPLFYLAGAGSVIFWVIGASIFFVVLHALFYASEPLAGAEFQTETV